MKAMLIVTLMLCASGCPDVDFGDDFFGGRGFDAADVSPPRDTNAWSPSDAADTTPSYDYSGRAGLAGCDPGDERWNDMAELYRATDASVHELIACGGAQVGLARTLMTKILLSNPEAFDFDPDTRATLESLLGSSGDNPFIKDRDGGWTMGSTSADRDIAFTIWFHDDEEVVREDPLKMESYLVGLDVKSVLTHDQMMADWNLDNYYLFQWDEPGPLAGLLNDGEPLPEWFVLHFSIWDFIMLYLGSPPDDLDFGPFESLGEVAMTSHVRLDDRPGDVVISYGFDGVRATVADLGSSQMVGFGLEVLDATLGDLTLTAELSDLRYVNGVRGLAGMLRYGITGPDVAAEVEADFGEGALYPESSWFCPE